ncbi:uncharacterized protein BDZ99DRAFT_520814 [Mytilinidion resinicola]|uniref:Uncharacterized protein n=1 Tax=Mytilinidion resinicola TaxID=574789 RepID=A0A6A6YLP6_9PEZI|nr:uncharacterized protein BDZ99DRAFT_520814 [Mytilinidion resinicola]KAF2809458.1 hypothetical protein BDZ99DRAFT_520814 [Mytilinidion resinicola]
MAGQEPQPPRWVTPPKRLVAPLFSPMLSDWRQLNDVQRPSTPRNTHPVDSPFSSRATPSPSMRATTASSNKHLIDPTFPPRATPSPFTHTTTTGSNIGTPKQTTQCSQSKSLAAMPWSALPTPPPSPKPESNRRSMALQPPTIRVPTCPPTNTLRNTKSIIPPGSWVVVPEEGRVCQLRNDEELKDSICTDRVDKTTLAALANGQIIVVERELFKKKLAFYPLLDLSVGCSDGRETGCLLIRRDYGENVTDGPQAMTLLLIDRSKNRRIRYRVDLTRKFWVDFNAVEVYHYEDKSRIDIGKNVLDAIIAEAELLAPGRSKEPWMAGATQGKYKDGRFQPGQLSPGTVARLFEEPEVPIDSMIRKQVDVDKFFGRPILVTEVHEDGSVSFLPITTCRGRDPRAKTRVLKERFMMFHRKNVKKEGFQVINYDPKYDELSQLSWLKIETTFRIEQKYLRYNLFNHDPVDIRVSKESFALIQKENKRVESSPKVCREATGPSAHRWIPGEIGRIHPNLPPDSFLYRLKNKPILIMGERNGCIQGYEVCLFGDDSVDQRYKRDPWKYVRRLAIEGNCSHSHGGTPLLKLHVGSLQMPQIAYVNVERLLHIEANNTLRWSKTPVRLAESALQEIRSWPYAKK